MVRTWRCNSSSYVDGFGCVRPGKTIDVDDDSVTDMIKSNFTCLDNDEVKAEKDKEEAERDMAYRAKVERLKDMKVKIPRDATREQIEALFEEHVSKVELPNIV